MARSRGFDVRPSQTIHCTGRRRCSPAVPSFRPGRTLCSPTCRVAVKDARPTHPQGLILVRPRAGRTRVIARDLREDDPYCPSKIDWMGPVLRNTAGNRVRAHMHCTGNATFKLQPMGPSAGRLTDGADPCDIPFLRSPFGRQWRSPRP